MDALLLLLLVIAATMLAFAIYNRGAIRALIMQRWPTLGRFNAAPTTRVGAAESSLCRKTEELMDRFTTAALTADLAHDAVELASDIAIDVEAAAALLQART